MQLVLILLFLILWKFNTNICTYFYGYDPSDPGTFYLFEKWYYLRDQIYEVLFLIGFLIPFHKITRISRGALVFGLVYIGSSVIDKSLGIFTEKLRDYFVVIPMGVALAYMIDKKIKNNEN